MWEIEKQKLELKMLSGTQSKVRGAISLSARLGRSLRWATGL